jgi:hypothetical protein
MKRSIVAVLMVTLGFASLAEAGRSARFTPRSRIPRARAALTPSNVPLAPRFTATVHAGITGYDAGEAKVIATDPAVRAYFKAIGVSRIQIGRLRHPKDGQGYSTATTEVSVWRYTNSQGKQDLSGDWPLTFYVHTLKRPAADGSRYAVTAHSGRGIYY